MTVSRSGYSIMLIVLGFMTMVISLMILFNRFQFGVIPPLIGFGIGGVLIVVGLALNPRLNKIKSYEEKFVNKLEKINQLPLEEQQKAIKKISLTLSATLFVNAAIAILMLKIYYHSFNSEFFLSYPF